MSETIGHTGTLEIIRRLPQSENGNPRYLMRVDGIEFRTRVDGVEGYDLPNYEGKRVMVQIRDYYGYPTVFDYGSAKD